MSKEDHFNNILLENTYNKVLKELYNIDKFKHDKKSLSLFLKRLKKSVSDDDFLNKIVDIINNFKNSMFLIEDNFLCMSMENKKEFSVIIDDSGKDNFASVSYILKNNNVIEKGIFQCQYDKSYFINYSIEKNLNNIDNISINIDEEYDECGIQTLRKVTRLEDYNNNQEYISHYAEEIMFRNDNQIVKKVFSTYFNDFMIKDANDRDYQDCIYNELNRYFISENCINKKFDNSLIFKAISKEEFISTLNSYPLDKYKLRKLS